MDRVRFFTTPGLAPLITSLVLITACSSTGQDRTAPVEDGRTASTAGEAAGSAVDQTRDGFADAALSPLEDLNLKREPIPPNLKPLKSPYSSAHDMSCAEIANAVLALDADLGRDWDAPPPEEDNESRAEWAANQSSDAALGAIASQARGFIPFRGLVREATGAESHADRVVRAYQLGRERRAFLQGAGLPKGCLPPAAPWPNDPEADAIVYRQHQGGN
ncbi:MAG: hypothetical protein AAF253_12450 [Pseudomonadota bacterium]